MPYVKDVVDVSWTLFLICQSLGPSVARFSRPCPEDVLGLPLCILAVVCSPLFFTPVASAMHRSLASTT